MLGSDEDPEGDGQPPTRPGRFLCPALHNLEYRGPTLWDDDVEDPEAKAYLHVLST